MKTGRFKFTWQINPNHYHTCSRQVQICQYFLPNSHTTLKMRKPNFSLKLHVCLTSFPSLSVVWSTTKEFNITNHLPNKLVPVILNTVQLTFYTYPIHDIGSCTHTHPSAQARRHTLMLIADV